MKNTLEKIEQGEDNFFIMVSYLTTAFESNSIQKEYFIYTKSQNGKLSNKTMNRLELKHFFKNKSKYHVDLANEDGFIYVLTKRPFIKTPVKQVVKLVQLKLEFSFD